MAEANNTTSIKNMYIYSYNLNKSVNSFKIKNSIFN